jgi:hypothetical protein
MKSINDLKILDFDYLVAKDDQVALRYSAAGSHSGEPYQGLVIQFLFRILFRIDLSYQ